MQCLLDGDMIKIGYGGYKLVFSQQEFINVVCVFYLLVFIVLMDNFFSYVSILVVNQVFDDCILSFFLFCLCVVVMGRVSFFERCLCVLLMVDGFIIREGLFDNIWEFGENFMWLRIDIIYERENSGVV